MSVNSSFNASYDGSYKNCFESRVTVKILTSQFAKDVLFVPLLLFIPYLGLQRWWQERSSTSTAAVMSHSDFFTYNMVVMDLINVLASGFYCFGAYNSGPNLQWVGHSIFALTNSGQTFFHLLTCVERYMAVAHPITYLGLRKAGGVKIRNVSTGCVWLLCFGMVGLTQVVNNLTLTITYFGIMTFFLVIICFCTISIVHILKHKGQGELSGKRERVDQSKLRALHTVVAILVALLFRLFGVLFCSVMFSTSPLTDTNCALGSAALWLTMPGSLVLSLLFLQRAEKLPTCSKLIKHNDQTRAR